MLSENQSKNKENLKNAVNNNVISINKKKKLLELVSLPLKNEMTNNNFITNQSIKISKSKTLIPYIFQISQPQQQFTQSQTSNKNANLIVKLLSDRRDRVHNMIPSEVLNEKMKLENEKESFSKSILNDSDIIFHHLFIDKNGDTNVQVNSLVFDNYYKEFILPDQSN